MSFPFLIYGQNQYQNFTNYTIEDGFQSMINYDVVQDHRGYIWLSTDAGISRFNGKDFQNYGINEGLDQNEVVDMDLDKQGRIWLNSSGKLSYIENDSIHNLDLEAFRDLYWNFDVLSDGQNTWLSAKHSLFYLDETFTPLDLGIINDKDQRQQDYVLIDSRLDTSLIFFEGYIEFRHKGHIKRKLKLSGSYTTDKVQEHQFFLENEYLFYCGADGLIKLNLDTGKELLISSKYKALRKIHKIGNMLWLSELEESIKCLHLENDKVISTENLSLIHI